MWQDMGLYWAWRGASDPTCNPPTVKHIEYEAFQNQRIACAVTENGKRTEVFKVERALARPS